MHPTLVELKTHLEKAIFQINVQAPSDEPLSIVHGNWSMPGLNRKDLIEEAQSIIDLINERGAEEINDADGRVKDYIRRIEFLHQHTLVQIWNNAAQAAPAYLLTLQGLRRTLLPALVHGGQADSAARLKTITLKLRSMEARIKGLEPRADSLSRMIERIEHAYVVADQLPDDLESLSEGRDNMTAMVKEAINEHADLKRMRDDAVDIDERLRQSALDAKVVMERCETAYSASTSVGLAAAFSERSRELSISMWIWVVGLVAALAVGSYLGSAQLLSLSELLKIKDASTSVVVLNLLLSILSVCAPVWFGWVATKQIGHRFRLAEDYAFKASISRAYEGFRREAARFDKDMEAKLLTSALTRFDELPLRLVESDDHGSPWHELASSSLVKQAFAAVPNFASQIKDLATMTLSGVAAQKNQSVAKPSSGVERENE